MGSKKLFSQAVSDLKREMEDSEEENEFGLSEKAGTKKTWKYTILGIVLVIIALAVIFAAVYSQFSSFS